MPPKTVVDNDRGDELRETFARSTPLQANDWDYPTTKVPVEVLRETIARLRRSWLTVRGTGPSDGE